MDRNIAASFSLSVLTVLFFAVVLFQPDRPPSGPKSPDPPATKPELPRPSAATAAAKVPVPAPVPVVSADPPAPSAVVVATRIEAPARPDPKPERAPGASKGAGSHAPRMTAVSDPRPRAPAAPPGSRQRDPGRVEAPIASTPRTTRPVARRTVVEAVPEPRGAFTKVRAGESLADVAARVYGVGSSAELLWEANRDLLDGRDAPLDEGALLRTP